MTLAERYDHLCSTPSSIHIHLPVLRHYAEQCESIAEFGVQFGYSTTAFLIAQPSYFCSYDVVCHPELQELFDMAGSCKKVGNTRLCKFGKTDWCFHMADSRKVPISSLTELLFIDSSHWYGQMKSELARHHACVRRWIICHDTVSYGQFGEAGPPQVGIMPAIEEFLAAHSEWTIREHQTNHNGLLIMERYHAD